MIELEELMNYFVRNHADADKAKIVESWGSLTWLANRSIGNSNSMTVGRVVIKKGESNPRHTHSNCEEILYLLTGKLEHTVGDEIVTLEAGDTLVIETGVFHNAVNIGTEDADMIVIYSSGDRDFVPE